MLVSVVFGLAHLSDWQPRHAGGNMIGILWIGWLSSGRVEDPTPRDFAQILADPRFGIACLVSIVAALGAVWSFGRLLAARARERPA